MSLPSLRIAMNECDGRSTPRLWRVELRPRESFVKVEDHDTKFVGGSSWLGVALGRIAG